MGASSTNGEIDARIGALSDRHKRAVERFRARLGPFLVDEVLNPEQVAIIEEYLVRLGEREFNPSNTGNLEDLFCYTLADTRDPIRAFAQALADTTKIVPMQDEWTLWPHLRAVDNGKIYKTVGDLDHHNAGEKMLITHTMVAYGDAELGASARAFIRATLTDASDATVERELARMIVQSQHGPSSTFVLSRARGLTLDLSEVYAQAGYSDEEVIGAQEFYDVCARFNPAWVEPFLAGFIPSSDEWSDWRRSYLNNRHTLPSELIYQLSSDTLTNFLDATLESGKWTDASILFGGVTAAEQVPSSLVKIVNQYIAEHIALHDRPAQELMDAVAEPLEPWGVGFQRGRAVQLPDAKNASEIRAQFDDAMSRMKGARKAS